MKNKSDVNVMLKEAGILCAITLIAGFLLGLVYEVTKEPRRLQQEKAIQEACVAVFPRAEEQNQELVFTAVEYTPGEEISAELAENGVEIGTVYEARCVGAVYGYVVEAVSSEGYGGDIVLYVGVGVDGTVNGVSITESTETAGLGLEAASVLTPQFADKQYESFVYTKTGAREGTNEVDAISGATITTKAVTDAVNGGLKAALELLEGGVVNE